MRSLLPSRADYKGLPGALRHDIVAGLTVGVVALPLALAFGITTGLGASAGLITAIVAGLVAAVFGGSSVQVSGPTGAMTVVLVPIVARFGTDAVFVVGTIGGIFVLVAAFARLGRYLAYIPWPVVEGFTIGIAVIIFLQQVPAALGVAKPEGENTAAVAARAVRDAFSNGSVQAIGIVALVAVVMLIVMKVKRAWPASLIAVVVATLVTKALDLDIARIGALPSSLPSPSLPHTSFGDLRELISAGFAVALLAAIESLLSAKVADGMVDQPRHDPNRELFGQGLANVTSSLFGGMPATGAIARTAVNVRAGARTRVASMVHSVVLLVIVLCFSGVVAEIPLAALAGVLMVTAIRMVEPHNVRAVLTSTRSDAVVLVLTAAATIAFDLIVAVEIGIAVAAVLALRHVARNSELAIEPLPPPTEVTDVEESAFLHDHIVVYRLDGALFFGAAQRFLTDLTAVTDVRVVVLRLGQVQVLDATGAHTLGEIVKELEDRHITVLLCGVAPQHVRILDAVGTLGHLAHERHMFDDLDHAIAHARRHAAGRHADHTADETAVTHTA